ncbi:hypothetical protein F66182_6351 [Fusarium sp. NRRL 66182]|nr:hypothetical protein F66182_6351 [Fusarium sp. NRRL 66182]
MGPLACVRMSARREKEKIYNPQPDQLDHARRKLSTVTTSTVLPREVPADIDVEASTPPAEFGECPICIGPLVPEPVHTVGHDPRPILEQVSTVTVQKPAESHGATVQAGDDANSQDDILTINTCGHSFHSKCLSSWFLIERHDCPVCRVPYYKGNPLRERTLSVSPFW